MYILITVGTTKFQNLLHIVFSKEFIHSLKKVDCHKLVIQTGDVDSEALKLDVIPKEIDYTSFRYKNNLIKEIEECDLIICHGGAGTILEALEKGKKVIAVANPELQDNHQSEFLEALSQQSYIFESKLESLSSDLENLKDFQFAPSPEPDWSKFVDIVTQEINK